MNAGIIAGNKRQVIARMQKQPTKYIAFLLRMWRENETAVWRASLQDPHTHRRRHFHDLPSLLSFLETQTGVRWLPDSTPPQGGDPPPETQKNANP